MSSTFESTLKSTLEDLPKGYKLNVYNIKTNLIKGAVPLFKNDQETPYRHQLILIESETIGFVCGLESYEYQVGENALAVYISKVDTSGGLPNGLTSRLVQSYISTLKQPCTVHVFARAQPQYLFAESSKNTEKKALNDRELVSWWLHTLNKVSQNDDNIKAWWYVPGIDDEQSALIEVGARKREWKSAKHIEWKYGSSYAEDALASQVIPRFEDDAKARLLKDHSDASLKVSEFWGLLSISEECGSGKLAGFFELKFSKNQQQEEKKNTVKNKDFTLFWNQFMSLDFGDRSSILKSSEKALQDIKRIFPDMKPLHIETKKEQSNVDNNNAVPDNKRQAINTLSTSFIKRRKK